MELSAVHIVIHGSSIHRLNLNLVLGSYFVALVKVHNGVIIVDGLQLKLRFDDRMGDVGFHVFDVSLVRVDNFFLLTAKGQNDIIDFVSHLCSRRFNLLKNLVMVIEYSHHHPCVNSPFEPCFSFLNNLVIPLMVFGQSWSYSKAWAEIKAPSRLFIFMFKLKFISIIPKERNLNRK